MVFNNSWNNYFLHFIILFFCYSFIPRINKTIPKMIQTTGGKIQTTSILAYPKSGIDIEKNKRTVNKNNPIINRMVARSINPVFTIYTSS